MSKMHRISIISAFISSFLIISLAAYSFVLNKNSDATLNPYDTNLILSKIYY